jgi:hypothetical protein
MTMRNDSQVIKIPGESDFRVWKATSQRPQRRERENEVSQRSGVQDQDFHY